MTARPRLDRTRLVGLMLLIVALLGQTAAPEGWMPVVASSGGVVVVPCDGMGPNAAMAMMMPGGKNSHDQMPHHGQAGDHPCAAAGIGIADAPPPILQIAMAPVAPIETPDLPAPDTLPGRGLAAPPPPATGPPARA
ncbi:hypothetical protein [Sphingomonas sp.]|jgi:hypothetical protein|uniref:hypothetical protein n=1 Tax=Sphingomonas sp. TaxID=28214 RepID=UPI002E336E22|nr:hypothetical protein [Sphingomonas sp.]HEX4694396.1 hypothetical protein [Sphingomonas sp.]